MKTTWRKMITETMAVHGETWEDVEVHTPFNPDREFDNGFGSTEGEPFYLWTANRVYFAHEYDGAEACQSVPRHPVNTEKPEHK